MGLPEREVLRAAQLPEDLLSRSNERLEGAAFFAFWRAMEAATEDELAIRFAQAISAEAFDPPLFSALCSARLSAAATRLAQYKPLICPMRLRVEEGEEELCLTMRWPPGEVPPFSLGAAEMLFWVAFGRLATRAPIKPRWVRFPVLPEHPEAYQLYLGARVERGPEWQIAFSREDAELPFMTAQESMWSVFEPELRRRLADLERGASMGERVKASLLEQLPAGESSVQAVARRLATSVRTLQRRLREEGTSFQQALAETRRALAEHYLHSSELSAPEISYLLGYEDPNSFYRAFQQWTGLSPERARRAAAG